MNAYPLKLKPYMKEVVWGGTRLRDSFGKSCSFERLGETWELSVRQDENSVIENGEYADMTLSEYLAATGNDASGFPLLVKFIDAREALSVQVHPEKTEMWYIVEAKPGAKLVYGLAEETTPATLRCAFENSQMIEKCLHSVSVHTGEVYFIPSGLVHAIGAGIVIAEIQQNNDTTYRLYDYERVQPDGTPRPLHVEEALDCIRGFSGPQIDARRYSRGRISERTLANCEFFNVERHTVRTSLTQQNRDFTHILCIDGDGDISGEPFSKGDSVFIPSGMDCFTLRANKPLTVLVSHAQS